MRVVRRGWYIVDDLMLLVFRVKMLVLFAPL